MSPGQLKSHKAEPIISALQQRLVFFTEKEAARLKMDHALHVFEDSE